MKINTIGKRIGIAIAALIVGYALFLAMFFAVTSVKCHVRAEHARQQIRSANPNELLNACRAMIAARNAILKEVPAQFETAGDVRFRYSDSPAYADHIPGIIRDMKPTWIEIRDYRVQVHVEPMPRTGFIGYIENGEKRDSMDWNRLIMLTNGLWLYDH